MEYEIISENVLHFPYAIKNSRKIVKFFENKVSFSISDWLPWIPGDAPEGSSNEYGKMKVVDRKKIFLEEQKLQKNILKHINLHDKYIINSVVAYLNFLGMSDKSIKEVKNNMLNNRPSYFSLKKYHKNKSMGPHPDSDDQNQPAFTISTYLTDGYVGGNLKFPTLKKSVTLTEGSIIIFPSQTIHQSLKIKSGVKCLITEVIFVDKKLLDERNIYD